MKISEIKLNLLCEAHWNPNGMDEAMFEHLKHSIVVYGFVEPMIVRPLDGYYEVLSGNQRLKAIREIGFTSAPCVIVTLKDQEAMLLAQALNNLKGEDDLSLKGTLLADILKAIPQNEVLSLLPETAESLQTLSSIGQEDLAEHLKDWEEVQAVRLKHMQLQFTHNQLETVEEALSLITPKAKDNSFNNPNTRGNAIFLLCKFYLERRDQE